MKTLSPALVKRIFFYEIWLVIVKEMNFSNLPDYSVLVENIPGNATKPEEWIEFFKSLTPLAEHEGKVADVTIAMNNGDSCNNPCRIFERK